MKMPAPMMPPTTSMVAAKTLSSRRKDMGCSVASALRVAGTDALDAAREAESRRAAGASSAPGEDRDPRIGPRQGRVIGVGFERLAIQPREVVHVDYGRRSVDEKADRVLVGAAGILRDGEIDSAGLAKGPKVALAADAAAEGEGRGRRARLLHLRDEALGEPGPAERLAGRVEPRQEVLRRRPDRVLPESGR